MLVEVRGVVVRTVDLTGSDKLLTLYTEERGIVSAVANGSRSLKSRYLSAAQLFCYASFVLEARGDRYWVREVDLIENFFGLRQDIVLTALGNYICEVVSDIGTPEQPEPELLRLTLNSLFAIAAKKTDLAKIKAAFEFRTAAILGFTPDLSCCAACGGKEGEMFLDVMNGGLICTACHALTQRDVPLYEDDFAARTRSVLSVFPPAVRMAAEYVLTCPQERLFSFRIGEDDMRFFARAAEEYLLHHLERGFRTLSFYKEVAIGNP